MDWQVSRSPEFLWQEVRQLLREPSTTIFHDIILHCSDGPLPWNRLCLALSFPSCEAVLDKQLNSESEVAVSLPDLSVWTASQLLYESLTQTKTLDLNASATVRQNTTSYTLVPSDGSFVEDFFGESYLDDSKRSENISDVEEKPNAEELCEKTCNGYDVDTSLGMEQLTINACMEGLLDSFDGGAPFVCIIETCGGKPFSTPNELRRHYVRHDPEMYASLKCPKCSFMRADNQPGEMRKHIMSRHDKGEAWASENTILDISEKLVQFREETEVNKYRGPRKPKSESSLSNTTIDSLTNRYDSEKIKTEPANDYESMQESEESDYDQGEGEGTSDAEEFCSFKSKGKYKRKTPAIEQLSIDAGMEGLTEGFKRPPFACVVSTCGGRIFKSTNELRHHYVRHDKDMHASVICPICKMVKNYDQKKRMKKHIMLNHNKADSWARENIILDIPQKFIDFRDATCSKKLQRPVKLRGYQKHNIKVANISIGDPRVRESFETGGINGAWVCGLPDCALSFSIPYELKRHYGKHDRRLMKDSLECNFCSFFCDNRQDIMKQHQQKEHPDTLFLAKPGEKQYKEMAGDCWEEYSKVVSKFLENNPNAGKHSHDHRKRRNEETHTVSQQCSSCTEVLNTPAAFEDHQKVHQPNLICFSCPQCQEGFAVEAVYENHVRSHSVLYDRFDGGVLRCNGCSLHFENLKDTKKHLSIYHANLLEKCEHCEHCSEFFTSKLLLKKHMLKHVEEVHKCPNCLNKYFINQEELDEHLSKKICKAPNSREVICPQCGRTCATKYVLKTHIKNVHEEKVYQYQCTICCTLYFTATLMKQHIRVVHKVADGEPMNDFYIFHSREDAKMLDVDKLNSKKSSGRGGK